MADDERDNNAHTNNGGHTWHNQQEANAEAIVQLQEHVLQLHEQVKELTANVKFVITSMREMLKLI
jgi:hypothetical protein